MRGRSKGTATSTMVGHLGHFKTRRDAELLTPLISTFVQLNDLAVGNPVAVHIVIQKLNGVDRRAQSPFQFKIVSKH